MNPKPPDDLQDRVWIQVCALVECLRGAEPKFPKIAELDFAGIGTARPLAFSPLQSAPPEIKSIFETLGAPEEIDVPLKYLHRCPPRGCGKLFWDRVDAVSCSDKCKKRLQRARAQESRRHGSNSQSSGL